MTDPWRYRCPEGHASWTSLQTELGYGSAQAQYYCQSCAEHFDALVDWREVCRD